LKNLISIIGLAPSEIPFQELLLRLSNERARVREAVASWISTPTPIHRIKSEVKTKGKSLDKSLKELIAQTGLTENQLLELIRKGGVT
jgi:uncharacterized protein YidB (DUF937 family)